MATSNNSGALAGADIVGIRPAGCARSARLPAVNNVVRYAHCRFVAMLKKLTIVLKSPLEIRLEIAELISKL